MKKGKGYEFYLIIGVLIGVIFTISIFTIFSKIYDGEKYKYPNELTEFELKNKLDNLSMQKAEIMSNLWKVNFNIELYEMELESKQKNLTVKYSQIGDSGIVVRLEYNESMFGNIEISKVNKKEKNGK